MRKQNIQLPCDNCAKPVEIKRWQLESKYRREHHFCNKPCRWNWQKKQPGIFLGKKHSVESNQKNRLAHIGKPNLKLRGRKLSLELRLKLSSARKAYLEKHPEVKEKIRLWATGRKQSKETIEKRTSKNRGQKRTPEQRQKIRDRAPRGKKNHFWRGGVSSEVHRVRNSVEYRTWRKSVFQRDYWTCQFCGSHGGQIHAHHQIPFFYLFRNRKDALWEIGNGVTLCIPCHTLTPTFKNNKIVGA